MFEKEIIKILNYLMSSGGWIIFLIAAIRFKKFYIAVTIMLILVWGYWSIYC
jgi:hypothetical protein